MSDLDMTNAEKPITATLHITQGSPSNIINIDESWEFRVEWEINGNSSWFSSLNSTKTKWHVMVSLESIGPGQEVILGTKEVEIASGVKQPEANNISYETVFGISSDSITVSPGTYRILTLITLFGSNGVPLPVAGYEEGYIQFYSSHPIEELQSKVLKEDIVPSVELKYVPDPGMLKGLKVHFDLRGLLTPDLLLSQLAPYLQAVAALQHIIVTLQYKEFSPVQIIEITQRSPIEVTLGGAKEAVELLQRTIVPWRRNHERIMSSLAELEKVAEIAKLEAEKVKLQAEAQIGNAEADKITSEVENQRLEAEKLRIEFEKEKLLLLQLKIDLILKIIVTISPESNEATRITYVAQFLPIIDTLIENPFSRTINFLRQPL